MTTPTQVRFPSRAVARSIVQHIVVLAAVVPLIVAAIGDDAPGWLVPILTGAVLLAGVVTRIMAIPAVNTWLAPVGLSAQPASVVAAEPLTLEQEWDGDTMHAVVRTPTGKPFLIGSAKAAYVEGTDVVGRHEKRDDLS